MLSQINAPKQTSRRPNWGTSRLSQIIPSHGHVRACTAEMSLSCRGCRMQTFRLGKLIAQLAVVASTGYIEIVCCPPHLFIGTRRGCGRSHCFTAGKIKAPTLAFACSELRRQASSTQAPPRANQGTHDGAGHHKTTRTQSDPHIAHQNGRMQALFPLKGWYLWGGGNVVVG